MGVRARRLLARSAKALSVFGAIATVARFWPSDRWVAFSIFAYAPSPFLLLCGLLCLFLLRKHSFFWIALNIVLAVAQLTHLCIDNHNFFAYRAQQPRTLRVFLWNVWGSRMGKEHIAGVMGGLQPEIICLNEPKKNPALDADPEYGRMLGGAWNQWSYANMLILSRNPIQQLDVIHVYGVEALHAAVESKPPITLLFLDVYARIGVDRMRAFRELSKKIPSLHAKPDVILGDMNTPSYSVSLRFFADDGYAEAYETSGQGTGYSWPSIFPMMRIDHIFAGSNLNIVRMESGDTSLSDHRWQLVDLKLKE